MAFFRSLVALAAIGGALASNNPPPGITALTIGSSDRINLPFTDFVTDANGLTLYIFNGDTPKSGVSTCYGACAAIWPPLLLAAGQTAATYTAAASLGGTAITGTIGSITRTDGTKQVTLNGYPLYNFVKDGVAGDVNCQGVSQSGDIWLLISPSGTPITYVVPGSALPITAYTPPATTQQAGLSTRAYLTRAYTPFLVDVNGYSYYIFGADSKGANASNCTSSACTTNWPPAILPTGATIAAATTAAAITGGAPTAAITEFTRATPAGSQISYGGYPLYYFINDPQPLGNGCQGVVLNGGPWWLVSPNGTVITVPQLAQDITQKVTVTLKATANASGRVTASMVALLAIASICLSVL